MLELVAVMKLLLAALRIGVGRALKILWLAGMAFVGVGWLVGGKRGRWFGVSAEEESAGTSKAHGHGHVIHLTSGQARSGQLLRLSRRC